MKSERVIVISGASKGIGKYLVAHYLAKGDYVIGCSRGESTITDEKYEHYRLDISDEGAVISMFGSIRKSHKRVDVLINNAGINLALSPFLLTSFKSAKTTFEVNFMGTFLLSREASKIMMRNSYGRIINFGSMAVRLEEMGESIYTASKAAIISMTRIMAKELNGYGITCNVVAPSAIKTDLTDAIDPNALRKVLQRNAINEFGEMSDVSNTIDWLVAPESSAITGQVIYLGGA
jgi:3-oxoacyl-[acyl-carrier protein] reductase